MRELGHKDYNDNDIQVLEGLEAVRKRPGMYIGTTGPQGLHHLVWEIVDNSVDEALAGYCDDIEVTIEPGDIIKVSDDGRGMPTGINEKTGLSTVETIFTVLHAGGKFGGGGYKVSGGLHGVGASVVNALSTWLEVNVYRDGHIYQQKFENGGHPVAPLKIIGDCDKERTGTTVRFKADPAIFKESTIYDYQILYTRLQELAFLNKGLGISLVDLREEPNKNDKFLYNGGIIEFVQMLNKNKEPINKDIIYVEGRNDNISIEVAMQYTTSYNENLLSFTNNIHTPEGGTHEDGVKRALTKIINNYAKKSKLLKEKDEPLTGEDVREGLTIVISCKHPDPQFEGQTKTKLGNIEVRKIADDVFSNGFERYLLENPQEAKKIVEKSLLASHARLAAKHAREVTRKNDLATTNFFGKLSDCKSKDPTECEIFIVEGDSAGGSAKSGRNSMTQAILPLRGKILNVEKARLDKALNNEEIRSIITAFGTGIGDEFDLSKLRYDKIIIMTDADVDGAHIRVLLLTLFFRFFRPIVEAGHIYSAQPPLFKIMHGKTRKYLLSEADKEKYLNTFDEKERSKCVITRMKGLGEMDADELYDTTMDIKQRILRKITVQDCIQADATFEKLMGDEVGPRREFIETNAGYVQNLDI